MDKKKIYKMDKPDKTNDIILGRQAVDPRGVIGHRRLKITFVVATLLLLSLSIFSYFKMDNLISSSSVVNHTNIVKLEIEGLYSELNGLESAQRGYILTHNKVFLEQFNTSLNSVHHRVESVRRLTKDNYSQQVNLNEVEVLINKRICYLKKILGDSESHTITTDKWIRGKNIMDEVRQHLDKMTNEEDFLLRNTKSLTNEMSITPRIMILLMVCSILVVLVSYITINRELKISNKLQSNLEIGRLQLTEANDSLLKSNESLEKVNKELESFTYISSHDLQEPLRKIQTFISRIIENESQSLSEDGKNYIRRTEEAARRMQIIIRDLLEYSKLNLDALNVDETDIHDIVDEIKQELDEEIAEKNIKIEVISDHKIQVVASQFHQLLINLISNSIKFSDPEKKSHIIIENKFIKSKDFATLNIDGVIRDYSKITIRDNGIGFDSQYKSRIFEVFQRLHTKTEYAGTGIGLAIVKKIVENHKGYITADGELGKGTVFTIYIPAKKM